MKTRTSKGPRQISYEDRSEAADQAYELVYKELSNQ